MTPFLRKLGTTTIAAVLLIAGGVKLWASDSGVVAAGALFGSGLVILGISVREWMLDRKDGT